MMNSPESPDTAAARAFVRVTAQLSLALAVPSVLWSLLQLPVAVLATRMNLIGPLQSMLPPDMSLPSALLWTFEHAVALSVLLLALSLAFLAVSWGLFRYRQWGRIGFMAFLVVTAMANFALLPLFDSLLMDHFISMFPADFFASPEGREIFARMQGMRWFMLFTSGSTMLLIAALHGWLAFKLQRPQMRRLFD